MIQDDSTGTRRKSGRTEVVPYQGYGGQHRQTGSPPVLTPLPHRRVYAPKNYDGNSHHEHLHDRFGSATTARYHSQGAIINVSRCEHNTVR